MASCWSWRGRRFTPTPDCIPSARFLERRCGINRLTEPVQRSSCSTPSWPPKGRIQRAVPLLAPVLGIAPEHGYEPMPAEGRKLQELIA